MKVITVKNISIRAAAIDIEGNSYLTYGYVDLASIAVLDLDC
jgi:hypothetical protein